MLNLTMSVVERIVRSRLKAAKSVGMSLDEPVRRFLAELAGGDSAAQDIAELRELSMRSGGASLGQRLDRQKLHERSHHSQRG